MKEIKKISLSNLLNEEIPTMIKDVIEILDRHNLETIHLQEAYNVLVMQEPIANKMVNQSIKHHLTPELARLHQQRLSYSSLINAHVKAKLNIDDDNIQYMAIISRTQSKRLLTYLGQHNRDIARDNLHRFFLALDTGEVNHKREAFKALGVQSYIDKLRKANTQYNERYDIREADLKKSSRKNNVVIRKESLRILRHFFEDVDTKQKIYKDVDYSQLVHELNLLLTANSKRIKTRIATNKRIARKKAKPKLEPAAKENKTSNETKTKKTTPLVDKNKTEANPKTTNTEEAKEDKPDKERDDKEKGDIDT